MFSDVQCTPRQNAAWHFPSPIASYTHLHLNHLLHCSPTLLHRLFGAPSHSVCPLTHTTSAAGASTITAVRRCLGLQPCQSLSAADIRPAVRSDGLIRQALFGGSSLLFIAVGRRLGLQPLEPLGAVRRLALLLLLHILHLRARRAQYTLHGLAPKNKVCVSTADVRRLWHLLHLPTIRRFERS